jgi:hypothetical protein
LKCRGKGGETMAKTNRVVFSATKHKLFSISWEMYAWAQCGKTNPETTEMLLGWSEMLRKLAEGSKQPDSKVAV